MNRFKLVLISLSMALVFQTLLSKYTIAQTVPATDTSAATNQKKEEPSNEKSKRKATYVIYTGVNFSTLSATPDNLNFNSEIGWQLGAAYRSNGFFYWQVGLRYNNPTYKVSFAGLVDTGDHKFYVSDIDIPITGGINVLSATNRILNLRFFLSAVPAFTLNTGGNDVGIAKDSVNSFIFYGQAGVGTDILFLVLEVGYNYGFSSLFKNEKGNPGELFVNVGFRF